MKKALIVICTILFVAVTVCGITFYVLFQKATDLSEADKLNTTESKTIYEPLVKSVILGEPQEVTDDDINGLLASIMKTYNENHTASSEEISIKSIAVYLQDNDKVKIYADVYYKDIRFIFSTIADVSLDNVNDKISFDLSQTKIGTLSISKDTVRKQLNEYINNQSEAFMEMENDKVVVPSEYNIPVLEKNIQLSIESLKTSNGKAMVKTNSAMNVIGNFLSEYLLEMFK